MISSIIDDPLFYIALLAMKYLKKTVKYGLEHAKPEPISIECQKILIVRVLFT